MTISAAALVLVAPAACSTAYATPADTDDRRTVERTDGSRDADRGQGRTGRDSADDNRSAVRNRSGAESDSGDARSERNPGFRRSGQARSSEQAGADSRSGEGARADRRSRGGARADGRSGRDEQEASRSQAEPEGQEASADGQDEADQQDDGGLDLLGRDCSTSDLPPHDGFQRGPRCVSTAFGEVAEAEKNPSLLITDAPDRVESNQSFTLTVSTRNLVRDRFLPAADGGYYLESSRLNAQGIQRGHFHTACRMLQNADVAPDPAPEPAAFVAAEDGGGGVRPDQVTVEVPGLPGSGTAQCAVWAGDGSHRIPMMERANQIPAFDVVRIQVG